MRAIRLYHAGDLRLEEVPVPPPPAAGFVNLQVLAAGICGSDLHNYRTGQWISRSPSTAGHEFCARVLAVGAGVDGIHVGDTVVVDSRVSCGQCPACLSGRSNICENLGFVGELCDGGFAEQVQLPARLLLPYQAAISPRIAAMAEPLAVALHALHRLDAPPGEPVLIVGCGTIGGFCALLLANIHQQPLLLAEPNTQRLHLVSTVTGGQPCALTPAALNDALQGRRLRYAIDASGNARAIQTTLELMAGGGALALVGISHSGFTLDPNLLVEKEIALLGCHAFNHELPQALALLPELAPQLEQLSEVIAALEAIPQTYERLLNGGSCTLKSIVEL